jgi:DnaJ-class molecular chaperone
MVWGAINMELSLINIDYLPSNYLGSTKLKKCPVCNGSQVVLRSTYPDEEDGDDLIWTPCRSCHGKGYIISNPFLKSEAI